MGIKTQNITVPLKQSVGEVLRRLRHRERVSVRRLASKCGFSPNFIPQAGLNQTEAACRFWRFVNRPNLWRPAGY